MTDEDPVPMRERVKAAYDDLAADYAAATGDAEGTAALLNGVDERLAPGSRILDVGCGDGRPVSTRFEATHDVVGLDVSREQLRLAAERVHRTRLLQGEMTALPIRRSAVDAVVAFYSIIHVPRDEHSTVFAEWARVLRPGGVVLFSTGETAWEGENPDWLDSGVEMAWSYPDPEETARALETAGFEVLRDRSLTDPLAGDGAKRFFLARTRNP